MSKGTAGESLVRDFVSSIGVYSWPFIIRALCSFITVPIFTRQLTPADYGVMELLDLTLYLFATTIGANFGQAVFFYYARAQSEEQKRRSLGTAFYGALLPAAAAAAIATFLAPFLSQLVFHSDGFIPHLRLIFFTLTFTFPAEAGMAILRARNQIKHYSLAQSVRLSVNVLLTIVLLTVFHMRLFALLWSSLTLAASTAVYLAVVLRHDLSGGVSLSLLKQMFAYSLPLNVSNIFQAILDSGDRYFLAAVVTLAELGIYGLAYKLGMLVLMMSLLFNQHWKPRMYDVARRENGDVIHARVGTYYILLIGLAAVGISTVLPAVLPFVVGKDFSGAAPYIPWVAAICVLKCASDFFRNALYMSGKTSRDTMITFIGAAICVLGYFTLIPVWRLYGAIAATLAGFGVILILSYRWGQQVKRFPYENRRLIVIAASIALILTAAGMVQESAGPAWRPVLSCLLFVCYPLLLWAARVARADEIDWLRNAAVRFGVWRSPVAISAKR